MLLIYVLFPSIRVLFFDFCIFGYHEIVKSVIMKCTDAVCKQQQHK